MRIFLLIIAIAFVTTSAMAHNPLSAKFELNASSENGAILNIYLSQTGLHQTLIKHFSETDFTKISQIEYKNTAVQYLKKHINISADNTPLILGEGGIKLGNHQTDLKFFIENYPSQVRSLEVHINTFKENENHHSVFWWKKKDGKSKVILSAKNDFRGVLDVEQSESAVLTFLSLVSPLWLFLGMGATFLALIAYLVRKEVLADYAFSAS